MPTDSDLVYEALIAASIAESDGFTGMANAFIELAASLQAANDRLAAEPEGWKRADHNVRAVTN